ncbi:tRNA (guanosine(18)-2'-O)-methyltransferase TrmH [Lacimicrobium alkaliphilum]|uniref:tRNA (guanosine(18)-2'-O)-methyltransferase n=1 Tax=Lacimicrobium alkaliphilum TaxID=1526571 RepID=A0ABQ1R7D4_9ALTE|nr:tRNA (guanosine(18)-2'-O)-methyltransferase TrmH [Lacimicrobium alkaliphilum]GGD60000.1 tRNA (guanosine(18)-2'-O)-methyltransferase [Lacimicrobium alkaliphilum]
MTPERYQRIRKMLALRQPDLAVCLEKVHKPHNLAAIMRNCDAVGAHNLHVIWNTRHQIRSGTSVGSQNWLKLHTHADTSSAIDAFNEQNMQILVTHLSDKSVDFRDIDYCRPTAILFGQEKYGATDQALEAAHQHIVIPMQGMVQSLNVSVAGALVLYEAQRQRQQAGLYEKPRLDEAECQRILFEGGYPRLKTLCRVKGLEYPEVDEQGQIRASQSWWQRMREHKGKRTSNLKVI